MLNKCGYEYFCDKSHHLGDMNGIVYVHRVNAEIILGRKLLPGEVVHHIDMNKSNNSLDNLLIFKTTEDHVRFHMSENPQIYKLKDGTYICPEKKYYCNNCGKLLWEQTKTGLCRDCYLASELIRRKVKNRPTKEKLFELLSIYPFTTVGKMYGVSDNAVRKWCKGYDIPSHSRDYR